jgi:F420-dependent oxidoreductase-like protein
VIPVQIGMPMSYAGGFAETVEELRDFEAAGLDVVLVPEAYSFDAVSQLGFIAAKTSTVKITSSILNIYSRTPSLLAMTAAGLDYVSGGRFVLGIGASGPQVVEGFHGVRFDAPLTRTREVVEICRAVWRREVVEFHGQHHQVPLTLESGGTGLGKPLKLINRPVRERIPILLAAMGPRSVTLAAEICEGWQPMFYLPEAAGAAFGSALDAGRAKRAPELGPLDIVTTTKLLVSDDPDEIARATQTVREQLALYVGGMGARGKNFYTQLVERYGFEEHAKRIQELYLAGRKAEAAAAVPDELAAGVSLIGPRGYVCERVAAFAASGITTLAAMPLAAAHVQRVRDIAALREFSRQST